MKSARYERFRRLVATAGVMAIPVVFHLARDAGADESKASRPNILFCIADDWGWPHAGAYGDPVVETPTFDRLAREGILFEHAFVSSPSCTPSRAAILTGQFHWRLQESANLWSTLRKGFTVYPESLAAAGYHVGSHRKGWGPGRLRPGGRTQQPAGRPYENFEVFLEERPDDTPFCFWLGSSDPHRPYRRGSGRESGMAIDRVPVPAFYPDVEEIRSDIADYYWEVQRFDRDVGRAVALLEEAGELDRTIVVMTGDHGMPFPRCKANLYDWGARVPLALRWGARVKGDRTVTDFVSLTDLAPTFLEAAGVDVPDAMTGRSLREILESEAAGRVDDSRDFVLLGKERHVPCQERGNPGGTPMRAIRTDDYLLIRNFKPSRWPAGTPNYERAYIPGAWLADCDNGPTKTYLVEHRDDANVGRFHELSFARRSEIELYHVATDRDQVKNVANDPDHAAAREELEARLVAELRKTGDPRIVGGAEKFDRFPYYGGAPKHPDWKDDRGDL